MGRQAAASLASLMLFSAAVMTQHTASAFAPVRAPARATSTKRQAFSFPSLFPQSAPTANDAAAIAELKSSILNIARGKDNGVKATPAERDEILRLAKDLDKKNKVRGIARSPAMDGTWRLVFTTTKGSSSGKLGPLVGDVLQEVDTKKGIYINYVRLFGGAIEGSLDAGWEVTGADSWKVIFNDITFKILGFSVGDKKSLGGQAGIWRMTYLDDDFRILYAASITNEGKPARVENIYILKKV